MKQFIAVLSALLMIGCGGGLGDDSATHDVAVAWAEAYFNADYHTAEQYVTPESRKWIRFAASNTTEADLKLLNEQHAEVEADGSSPLVNDTLHVVTLIVSNYLSATAFNEAPRQEEEGKFLVTVVKRDDDWLVRMEGLPRSEKQSRD